VGGKEKRVVKCLVARCWEGKVGHKKIIRGDIPKTAGVKNQKNALTMDQDYPEAKKSLGTEGTIRPQCARGKEKWREGGPNLIGPRQGAKEKRDRKRKGQQAARNRGGQV